MSWQTLTSLEEVRDISENISYQQPCLIFKHSTTCSISSIAKHRLADLTEDQTKDIQLFYLDLLSNRQVSNFIAENFQVQHESPQILLIKNGECVYEESHLGISINEILEQTQLING